MSKKSFAELLVDRGIGTPDQLKELEQEAAQAHVPLYRLLIEKKIATPEQVAQALAAYAEYPVIEKVTDAMADLNVLAQVPLKFLRDNYVMPLMVEGKLLILAADPLNFPPIDQVNLLLGGGASVAVGTEKIILDAINRYYPLEGGKAMIAEFEKEEEGLEEGVDFGEIGEKDIVAMAAEAPIIKLVNHILYQAVKRGASDIHIEPFEKELSVRYRIDGVMHSAMTPPKRIQGAISSRLKIMANLNIAEKRIPQDGRIDLRVAGRAIDIRVSILPVAHGERIVMRLLDKSRTIAALKDMGFSERDFKLLERSIARPNGILYITGPTGSGKTTTLYAILSQLNKPEVNIITVEDPVEYQMPGIGQVQVREKIGLTFAAALRSILRQDPDIIMIGETRDQETAQIAVQSALTGHLVLSTLHTNSAPATITRLLDMGVEPYLIASSVVLALAQRLVRKLCPHCKKVTHPTADLLESIGLTPEEAKTITFYEPVGCEECAGNGYRGRLPIFEIMDMTNELIKLVIDRADTSRLRRQAMADGMTLLIQDGLRKIKLGLTTIEEVLSAATIEGEVE